MGTGYTRNDTTNQIADGEVIDAADLDGEFDAIVAAFSESTGHTHDGTGAEGGAIEVVGPAQDYIAGAAALYPKATSTYALGTAGATYTNVFTDALTLGGTAVTATAAELNKLDGATVTTAELNKLDGALITTAELNYLVGQDQYLSSTDGPTFATVNATTFDTTNLEVTNIKAKDGTAAASIANATGVVTVASSVLTTTDINGGTIDGTVIGGTTPAAGTFTTLTGTADATINGITVGNGAGSVGSNTAVGFQALQSNTTGTFNTAVGREALQSNTIGVSNTAQGYLALQSNTEGVNNTAVGRQALASNLTGNNNTAVGLQALRFNTTGVNNTAQGYLALQANTTGINNTAHGFQALLSNTIGEANTAVGNRALESNTEGINSTAVGRDALRFNTTGANNTAVGLQALKDVTSGSGNLGLAFRTSGAVYSPVFNPIGQDNRIVMGHTDVTNAYVQVAWTVVSDARDKAAFAPVPHGLDFVNSLKPTEYQFKENGRDGEADGIKRYGFLAQDVLELEGDNPVIVDTEDLDKLKLKESNLIPVLVNAIQELTAEVQTLKAKLEAK